ncbi:hypothetical protein GCM10010452_86110 [Crossiella cryophila]
MLTGPKGTAVASTANAAISTTAIVPAPKGTTRPRRPVERSLIRMHHREFGKALRHKDSGQRTTGSVSGDR